MRVVHLRLHVFEHVFRRLPGRKATFIGNGGNRRSNAGRDLPNARQRRIKTALAMLASLTSCASVRAATMNISSVTRRVPLTMAPRPTPGKMYELLPWRGTNVLPPSCTGSYGLPHANSARPSVWRYASSAEHSAFEVGLDSAKMIGRLLICAIVCKTSGVKVPPTAATPIIALGFKSRTALRKSATGAWSWA